MRRKLACLLSRLSWLAICFTGYVVFNVVTSSMKSQPLRTTLRLQEDNEVTKLHVRAWEETPEQTVKAQTASHPMRLCSQEERVRHLRTTCMKQGKLSWEDIDKLPVKHLPPLKVDDKHEILYCDIPKVASTMWLKYIAVASRKTGDIEKVIAHNAKKLSDYGIKQLSSFNETEIRYRVKHYLKFIVARHPYSRLVSVWRDKFRMPDSPYIKNAGRKIITQKRGEYKPGELIYFQEFVDYIVNGAKDHHWRDYQRCLPCTFPYNFISRTETSFIDSHEVLARLEMNTSLPVIHSHDVRNINHTSSNLEEFVNVTEGAMTKLYAMYGPDVEQFGYDFDWRKREAACQITGINGELCC